MVHSPRVDGAPGRVARRCGFETMARAAWTLSDVFGQGHVYVPTPAYDSPDWLPRERAALDFLTGAQLAIAGDVPIVCHRAVSTPAALSLLEEAGHPLPQRLLRYHDAGSYRALLSELVEQPTQIGLQHAQRPGAIPDRRLWIPDAVLRLVNDKGRLGELVPADRMPERRVVEGRRLREQVAPELRPPIVLKAAEGLSSGAGCGVRLCRTPSEIAAAVDELGRARAVVVEELVHFELSWCVQAIVRPDGAIRSVGLAEQICDENGAYRGNWLSTSGEAPPEVTAVGEEVAARVAERGYRGFVGVDIGLASDGRVLAFDVNGRINGSSAALAVFSSVAGPGRRFGRYGTWVGGADFESLANAVRAAMRSGAFVPLAFYDPRGGDASAAARVSGVIVGATREEVVQVEKDLAASIG